MVTLSQALNFDWRGTQQLLVELSNCWVFRLKYADFRCCLVQIGACGILDVARSELPRFQLKLSLLPTSTSGHHHFVCLFDDWVRNKMIKVYCYVFSILFRCFRLFLVGLSYLNCFSSLISASCKIISGCGSWDLKVEIRLKCLSFGHDTYWAAPCTQTDTIVSQK